MSTKEKKVKKSSPIRTILLVAFLAGLALAPTYAPNQVWHALMVADFFLEWKLFSSPWAAAYHQYLVNRLPERPEMPAREILLADVTKESLYEASNGYTVPVIIRGGVADTPAIKTFTNVTWWLENYGDEPVLCKYIESLRYGESPACTVKDAIGSLNQTERLYISGESKIFVRRPELLEMVESELIQKFAPGKAVFTQLFMGFAGMGSDVHAAVGCNMFRMIAGRKKWWLFPPTQTPYLYSSLNQNGFSAHTKTQVGKGGELQSPWMNKLERYTVTLEPGDMLLNTAWYWHGIHNLGEDPNALIIGVPTRYSIKHSIPAFRSNWLLTSIALGSIQKNYGGTKTFTSHAANLQDGIEKARKSRAAQMFGGDGKASVDNVLEQ